MALVITGTRDQALLTMVIEEARKAADQSGGYVGRTAVQKILYFLKATGVPMQYGFDIYHYGPYSDEIQRDMEWLQADGVIIDRSTNSGKYSNYAPGGALQELLGRHETMIEQHRDRVRQVVGALVPMRPERLELIATLDYLYRWFAASGKPGPWKEIVVEQFMKVKKDRFPRSEVERTYDVLANAQLIGA